MSSYTYLVRCADGTLYAGWTNNIEKRLQAHNSGAGAKYTRARRPVALAYLQAFENKSEAMACEAKLKRLKKVQKEQLVHDYLQQNM